MTHSPEVLVGISTFNRCDILGKAIESALSQSHPKIRVAVVDDASTDATPKVRESFPQIQWTRWDDNRGYVAARNYLMLNSGADYYVSLDDDAWFLEGDEIAVALGILEENPRIAAVAFDILSPERQTPVPRSPATLTPMFIGCGHILRLETVRALEGYAYFPGAYGVEEKDLCLRLMDAGFDIVKMPGLHVWHDKSATARDLLAQHRSGVCNDLSLAIRRVPMAMLPIAIAWKLFRHIQFAIKARLMGACLAGMRAFIFALPATWRGRKPVKASTFRRFGKL